MKEEYRKIEIEETSKRLHMPDDMVIKLMIMSLKSDMLEKLDKSFSDANLEDARIAIHTIKGTAANVGLVGLSKLALKMELEIKDNNYFDFELLAVMKEVWEELEIGICN